MSDFILTFAKNLQKDGTPSDKETEKEELREYYTSKLIKEGVDIEYQNPDVSYLYVSAEFPLKLPHDSLTYILPYYKIEISTCTYNSMVL